MKILVTGADGMLGSDLTPILSGQHTVKATDVADMDVSKHDAVIKMFEAVRPDIVIHLAAQTDVDRCETDPMEAYRSNTLGTENIALACQRFDKPLVYVSTLSVFDGTKPEPYTEFDTPNPQSHYSRSKYQGEMICRTLLNRFYIVRAGWMFGGRKKDKKFVAKIVDLARSRSSLNVVNDKFGSPTYTLDISHGIAKLMETGFFGTYHMVNTGDAVSRYDVARHILNAAGIKTCRIDPVSSDAFPLPAPRPRMEAGINRHLELRALPYMRSWQTALQDYVKTL